jgi:YVTN family beta-propeller protein
LTTCPIGDPGSVSVINTATNTVIKTILIPYEPTGVAVSLDETRLYVVNACGAVDCESSANFAPGHVSVIDVKAGSGTENTVIGTIPLTDLFSIGIAVSQDGSRLYVTNLFDPTESFSTVSVIDTTLGSVIDSIVVPPFPTGIVLNPNSPRLYVVTEEGGLSVADTTSDTLINYNNIEGIGGLAITPDGARLYAPDLEDELIDVIDTTNDDLHLVRTIPVPTGSPLFSGFTAHPDGRRVYVTVLDDSFIGGSVAVIRTDRNRLSGPPITVGDLPIAFGQFIAPGSIQGLIDLLASFNASSSVTNLLDAPLEAALAS